MLVFARRQELKNEIIDIPSLVYGMSDLLERSLGSSIAIDARFPAAISPVLTDSNQLEMALLNMVVNARDAMPGGGTITISAREQMLADRNVHGLKEGSYVVLSVTDRGAGMDIETLQHATEPFFTTKGVGKGTGLGLSMVHGLAEQSKGRLVLESEVGRGTIASLWLPMHQGDAEPILAPMNDRDAGETSVPSLSILAVDDDALVLMNTAAMLEDLGHKVTTAMSGSEAAKLLEINDPFDLLITDQGMPGMTGVELIAIARGQRPDLPVLLATGYADLPAGLALNVPRLPKPYMQEHLSKAVMEAMRRQVR
jgi:CheY-like chemotaxis protein